MIGKFALTGGPPLGEIPLATFVALFPLMILN